MICCISVTSAHMLWRRTDILVYPITRILFQAELETSSGNAGLMKLMTGITARIDYDTPAAFLAPFGVAVRLCLLCFRFSIDSNWLSILFPAVRKVWRCSQQRVVTGA